MESRLSMRANGHRMTHLTAMARDLLVYALCAVAFPLVLALRHGWSPRANLLCIMWLVHFVRRCYEVAFVHQRKAKLSDVAVVEEVVSGTLYYSGFAVWNAWAVCNLSGDLTSSSLILFVAFLVAEFGNWYHHGILASLKRDAAGNYALPRGGLFEFVAGAHYLCEILSWVIFSISAGTVAAYLFTLVGIMAMSSFSKDKHAYYLKTFDGKNGRPLYPASRTRLIPFLW